jgi:hypothetical protein
MADKHWKYESNDDDYSGHSSYSKDFDSDSDPKGNNNYEDSPPHPKISYHPYAAPKAMKKVHKHKVYDPGYYAAPKHQCPPVVCDPQYIVRDCYVPRMVPYVHPVVNVNRHVIVNVPTHVYRPVTRNVVVDPGCPCPPGHHPHGYY